MTFGTDPDADPDPGIFTLDLRIRIRIWIQLFSPVTSKMPTKNKFFLICFSYYFLQVNLHQSSKDEKSVKSHYTAEIKVFIYFFVCWLLMEESESGSVQINYGSGSMRPKNKRILRIRIQIQKAGFQLHIVPGEINVSKVHNSRLSRNYDIILYYCPWCKNVFCMNLSC